MRHFFFIFQAVIKLINYSLKQITTTRAALYLSYTFEKLNVNTKQERKGVNTTFSHFIVSFKLKPLLVMEIRVKTTNHAYIRDQQVKPLRIRAFFSILGLLSF